MKRIKNRAFFAVIISLAIVAGLCVYIARLWNNGEDWAMLRANKSVFHEGVLDTGTLTDRNGLVLAAAGDGVYRYADDEAVRRACLHAAGDYGGNIGTGALTVFASRLAGYSFVGGVNSLSGGGKTVAMTIDARLQTAALSALAGRRGAVFFMDYETGEVLCMVSAPAFDPSVGADLSLSEYEGAYINRCLSTAYVPGSVFKIVTLAAAIENLPDLYTRSFYCAGAVDVGGDTIKCTGVHGQQTIEQAFANSCNCAFSEISQELGSETIIEYAKMMGVVDSFSIEEVQTASGNIEKTPDGSSSLSWSGIGQHNDLVVPAAMARLCAAIANGGTVNEPKLLLKGSADKTAVLKAATADRLREMMAYNVTYAYGEGLFPGYKMYAKTGTAEVGDGTSHAWFTGFISGADTPLAFAVIIENAGGGLSNSAPVANAVIQAAINS